MEIKKAAGIALVFLFAYTNAYQVDKLLYSDDFNGNLSQWVVEKVGGSVTIKNGVLSIIDNGGTTVWFNKAINDSIAIEYNARMLSSGGLTDLNCFWMARDPRSSPALAIDDNFFKIKRGGLFATYDSLNTYYVGFGANGNTTFRFRRYYPVNNIPPEVLNKTRDINRVILLDHDSDGQFKTGTVFLVADKWYKIRMTYNKGQVEFFLDNKKAFDYHEQSYDIPYNKGFFGFRTTANSHVELDSLRIYQLTSDVVSIKETAHTNNKRASPMIASSGKAIFYPNGKNTFTFNKNTTFFDMQGRTNKPVSSRSKLTNWHTVIFRY